MARMSGWARWGRHLTATVVGAGVAFFAFVLNRPVPILDWFDLGVHEAGHLLTWWLPQHLMLLAGSIAQIAFPLAMAAYFGLRRRDPAGGGFCLVWAGASAWDVSVYAADAVAQQLPLVGAGVHDWNGILTHFGALHMTEQVAGSILMLGGVMASIGVAVTAMAAITGAAERSIVTPVVLSASDGAEPDPWLAAAQLPFRHEDRRSA